MSSLQQVSDKIEKMSRLRRFGDMGIKTIFQAFADGIGVIVSAQSHESNLLIGMDLPDLHARMETIELGKSEIHDHELRTAQQSGLDGLLAVVGNGNIKAVGFEEYPQKVGCGAGILHDQNRGDGSLS